MDTGVKKGVVCLSGGVGGAKLLAGLQRVVTPGTLTAVINTGDDFDHLGLHISPDIDTALYTLADLANSEFGWGRRDETWSFMETLEVLGGDTWFRLGDRDLALHVLRTQRLRAGQSLETVTRAMAQCLHVSSVILPMTNDAVRTQIQTASGELDFQSYFVRLRCEPMLQGIRFIGAETATIAPGVRAALQEDLRAILIAPSNPYLSIDPILALPGMRELLRANEAPIIAVTPIINGEAVKGPTAKILYELNQPISPVAVAERYRGLIDGFVVDKRDAGLADRFDVPIAITDTLMTTMADRERVARIALELAEQCATLAGRN